MVREPLVIKALREVKSNIKQYLSVILIAALAVTLFTGILSNWCNFEGRVNKIYNDSNMCDAIITTTLVSNNEDVNTKLNTFLKNKDIMYEKRLMMLGKTGDIGLNLVTFDTLKHTLNQPILDNGDKFSNDDVLVDKNILERLNINIGDNLNIKVLGLNVDVNLEVKITHTMIHPEALENSKFASCLVYLGKDALAKAINEFNKANPNVIPNGAMLTLEGIKKYIDNSYNQYLLKGPKTAEILTEVNSAKNTYDVIYALNRSDLPTNMNIEQDIIQAKKLLYIFPVIFYAVALLIILTSISQLIHKETKNIGLLRALGYTKREITNHYISIFMITSLIGSIIGIILGPLIIPFVLDQKYNILYQIPKIKMPFFRLEYLYSILILFIIVIMNTLIALNQTLRKLPANTIRGDNNYHMKDTLLDKIRTLDGKVLNIKMALRNMKRSVLRTLMVVVGVIGCSALLLAGFGIEDTLNNSVDQELGLVDFDVKMSYKVPKSIKDILIKNDKIKDVAEFAQYDIEIEKDSIIKTSIFMVPTGVDMIKFNIDDNSCLISTKVSERIGANVGDEISYTYNNKVYKVVITHILAASFSQGIFISTNSKMSHPNFYPTHAYIKANDNVDNFKLANELEDLEYIMSTMSREELLSSIDNTLGSIRIMTNTVKVFAILLAIIVLYNLALLNFNDRTRDIATLKVLGYTKGEIISSFVIEILVLTIIGSIFGLLLGFPLMKAVLVVNENPLLSYLYYIKPASYILTFTLTAISSVIMNIYMSKNIKKVKMVESLKSVE